MSPPPPLMPEIGVLALVPDRWSRIWQPRHHMLTRLARWFPVVWMEPPRGWRDVLAGRGETSDPPDRSVPDGFTIYRHGPLLPQFHRPRRLAEFTADARIRQARKRLRAGGCSHIVLYLWRAEFEAALRAGPFDLTCYHIDDEYSWSEVDQPLDPAESRVIRAVDQVFIHSPALLEKKGGLNPHTAFVPNGVDFAAHATPVPEPRDLAGIPHPRIGYTGYLKTQLDLDLIDHLSGRHPEWSFVFVGALQHPSIQPVLDELARRPNVHFLGAKPVHELATYPQHFDVCTMPYVVDGYTKYIYPMKLHEYLASGRPTVGTRIRSLEEFTDVVALASTPAEWSAALSAALDPAENTPERTAERQSVARAHDWDALAHRVATVMGERLGRTVPAFDGREPAPVRSGRA